MKAALVDLESGVLATDRVRIDTPKPAKPEAVANVFERLRDELAYQGPIGCTFPGVIKAGTQVKTAANLHESWIDTDGGALLRTESCPVVMINDADAAGLAEMRHGIGRGVGGVVVMVTIGTGLGTAVFTDGHLVANTELGHLEMSGAKAEARASGRQVKELGLGLRKWATRFDEYLHVLEDLLWPELFILGGGLSKRYDQWREWVDVRTPIEPASLRNEAGIVGAAMIAAGRFDI